MKEKSQIINDANEALSKRRIENERLYWKQRDELWECVPELSEISREIVTSGISLAKLSASGKADSDEYALVEKTVKEKENCICELLKKNGYPEDALQVKYSCKKCSDTGLVKDEDGNQYYCECFEEIFKELLLKESGLPYRTGIKGFDNNLYSENDKKAAAFALETAQKCIDNFPNDSKLFLLGKTGVGKTFLADMIGTELTKKGVYVVYVTLPELMRTLLYYGDNEHLKNERDMVRKIMKDAEMLIVDELGAEKLTDAKQELLTSLIDQRLNDGEKGTIIITNNTFREIITNYGERIFSRLQTMKIANIELDEGIDLRLKIKNA